MVRSRILFFKCHFPFKACFQTAPRMNFGWVDVEEGAGSTTNTCLIPSILKKFSLFMDLEDIRSRVWLSNHTYYIYIFYIIHIQSIYFTQSAPYTLGRFPGRPPHRGVMTGFWNPVTFFGYAPFTGEPSCQHPWKGPGWKNNHMLSKTIFLIGLYPVVFNNMCYINILSKVVL